MSSSPTFRHNLSVPFSRVKQSNVSAQPICSIFKSQAVQRFGTTYLSHLQRSNSPTFRHNLSVPSSRVKQSNILALPICPIFKGQAVPTFRHYLSVPSSTVKQSSRIVWPLKMEQRDCPETSATNFQSTQREIAEEQRSHLYSNEILKSRLFSGKEHHFQFLRTLSVKDTAVFFKISSSILKKRTSSCIFKLPVTY
jgi:hypothetical protein